MLMGMIDTCKVPVPLSPLFRFLSVLLKQYSVIFLRETEEDMLVSKSILVAQTSRTMLANTTEKLKDAHDIIFKNDECLRNLLSLLDRNGVISEHVDDMSDSFFVSKFMRTNPEPNFSSSSGITQNPEPLTPNP